MKGRSLLAFAVLSLALACEGNQRLTGPKAPLDASRVVSDGTRVGGNPDFFFLPPLVPNPVNNSNFERGKFNNRLQPSLSVEICQLVAEPLNALPTANTACVSGPAVKTFAAGTVRQVGLPKSQAGWWTTHDLPDEGFYYVLWDTRQSNLSTSAYYRIKVLLAGSIVLGFADVDPMNNMREFHNARTGDIIPFVDDASLPIPFRVEKGALCAGGTCNSAVITNTSTTGTQSVTVDAGGGNIAGASFPDGWLPSPEQCPEGSPCPQSVIVTVSEVNTPGSGLPGETTVCHPALNPKLQQFRACFNYTTTPTLQPFNDAGDQFAADVTVAVCYELEGTNDPRRDFAELYASGPNEPPHALEDVSEGALVSPATRNCSGGTPVITLRSSNPLTQLASTGWRKFKGELGRLFGVKTAYAVDQGLGGIVKGFSNVSPVLTANIEAYSSTELTLAPGATTTSTVRIMGSSHHGDHAPSGIGGVAVTFTSSSGALSAATVTTASDGTASVNWTIPATGSGPYTLTADGPALGGPITFTATIPSPDFVITTGAPTVTPLAVSAGSNVTLSAWTVRNDGGSWSGSIGNGFYLSTDATITSADTFLDENTNTSGVLTPGGSFAWGAPTLTIPVSTVPGVYYIGILVDRSNAVPESNENNNFVSVPIIVLGPDESQFFLAGNERRMVSMQTGATWRATVTPSFAPRGTFVWTDPSGDRIFISAGLGYVDVQAIIGGENIDADAAATVSGFYTDPATGGSVAGTELVMNSFSFNIFPRNTTLAWNAFPGAVAYHVVVNFGACRPPASCSASSWENNGVGNTYTAGLSHTFDFVGPQAGRWRVEALNANGNVINTSPYVYFAYII